MSNNIVVSIIKNTWVSTRKLVVLKYNFSTIDLCSGFDTTASPELKLLSGGPKDSGIVYSN